MQFWRNILRNLSGELPVITFSTVNPCWSASGRNMAVTAVSIGCRNMHTNVLLTNIHGFSYGILHSWRSCGSYGKICGIQTKVLLLLQCIIIIIIVIETYLYFRGTLTATYHMTTWALLEYDSSVVVMHLIIEDFMPH